MSRLLRLFPVAAALLLGLLLAACTITSDQPLVDDAEAAAPLPDAFTYLPYEWSADGYLRSTDAPASFVHQGAGYVSTDMPDMKNLSVRFVPIGNGVFLVAFTTSGEPGTAYGFARYSDGVLALALSPDDATLAAIARERTTSMPKVQKALAGLEASPESDAITLTSRAALDVLAHLYAKGRLPMGRLAVGYIAISADATPPFRLVQNGTQWISVP